MLHIICTDASVFLESEIYSQFNTLNELVRYADDAGEITIPYDSKYLDFCVKFLKLPDYLKKTCMDDIDNIELLKLFNMVNFLDCAEIMEVVETVIAYDISHMTTNDILQYFDKPPIDEEISKQSKKELAWFKFRS